VSFALKLVSFALKLVSFEFKNRVNKEIKKLAGRFALNARRRQPETITTERRKGSDSLE
jgi:hypothetical protein